MLTDSARTKTFVPEHVDGESFSGGRSEREQLGRLIKGVSENGRLKDFLSKTLFAGKPPLAPNAPFVYATRN